MAITRNAHIVFFCLGNICRSPTAHGVLRDKVQAAGWADRVTVDSAGTSNFHPGEPPDERSQQHALQRGYDLSMLRARQLTKQDFEQAEMLLAMDVDNMVAATRMCPPEHRHKLRRLTEFCRQHRIAIVPDPYYGGPAEFEQVLDLVEDACEGVMDHIGRRLGLQRG